MTTHALHRCLHCRTPYYYQPSGYGCSRPENHGTYCPECAVVYLEAVRRAFADVPRKFESRWVETQDVTVQTVEGWKTARIARAEAAGTLCIHRVVAPLFDLNDPSNSNVKGQERGVGEFKGRTFRYEYWTKRPGSEKVTEKMDVNLETGAMDPWRDLP